MRTQRARKFIGAGGTRRGKGARVLRSEAEQRALFELDAADTCDELDGAAAHGAFELGELARDIHRMTLETSSNVYAQRRSTW